MKLFVLISETVKTLNENLTLLDIELNILAPGLIALGESPLAVHGEFLDLFNPDRMVLDKYYQISTLQFLHLKNCILHKIYLLSGAKGIWKIGLRLDVPSS